MKGYDSPSPSAISNRDKEKVGKYREDGHNDK
jgi:hypothetical protein